MNTIDRTQMQAAERIATRAGQQIRATAGQLGDSAARTGEQLEESLGNLEVKFNDVRDSVIGTTKELSRTANTYVKNNTWMAIGISAGLAFLAGIFIGRRSGG